MAWENFRAKWPNTPKPPHWARVSLGGLFSVMVPACHCKIGCCSNVSLQPLIERQLHCQLQDLQQDPNGHQRPPKKYVATYCCTLGPCPLFRPSKFVHRPRSVQDGGEHYQAGARYLMRIHETLADRFPASCVEAEKSVGVPPHKASYNFMPWHVWAMGRMFRARI